MILSTKEIFKCIQQSKGISKFCPVVLLITETIAKYVCSRLDLLTCIYINIYRVNFQNFSFTTLDTGFVYYHLLMNLVPTQLLTIFIISSLLVTSTGTLKIQKRSKSKKKELE